MTALVLGFIWTEAATVSAVICIVLVIVAALLFIRYGKNTQQPAEPADLIVYFREMPVAVIGNMLRGAQKEVGAHEYIATLMALAQRGGLTVSGRGDEADNRESGSEAGVHEASQSQEYLKLNNLGEEVASSRLDAEALALLRMFSETGDVVYLATAQHYGSLNKEKIESAYRTWKQTVKAQTADLLSASKAAITAQRALLYGGYALIILAAVSAYLFTITVSLIFLCSSALIIALSMLMQRNIFVEKRMIRKLYQWIDTLETHRSDVPNDRDSIREILRYAVLFGIAEKAGQELQDTQASQIVDEEVAQLGFWRRLRDALYTTS